MGGTSTCRSIRGKQKAIYDWLSRWDKMTTKSDMIEEPKRVPKIPTIQSKKVNFLFSVFISDLKLSTGRSVWISTSSWVSDSFRDPFFIHFRNNAKARVGKLGKELMYVPRWKEIQWGVINKSCLRHVPINERVQVSMRESKTKNHGMIRFLSSSSTVYDYASEENWTDFLPVPLRLRQWILSAKECLLFSPTYMNIYLKHLSRYHLTLIKCPT